jgi:FAD/FMN-containing dehydrogenase
MHNMNAPDLAGQLFQELGPDIVSTDADLRQRRAGGWAARQIDRQRSCGRDPPKVSRCLALCHKLGIPVVPQGGMTGLAGGITAPGQIVLS